MAKENTARQHDEETQGLATEEAGGYTFNMKDTVATSGFPLLPEGIHNGVIEACDFKHSQSSGNPMWQVKWGFEDGELAQKNRKISSFVIFSGDQLGRAKMFLKRVAPELADSESFNAKEVADSGVMIGKRAKVKINTQKGQDGEPRSNVADVLAAGDGSARGSFSL